MPISWLRHEDHIGLIVLPISVAVLTHMIVVVVVAEVVVVVVVVVAVVAEVAVVVVVADLVYIHLPRWALWCSVINPRWWRWW